MLRRRLPASAILAGILLLTLGCWTGDTPKQRLTSSFTRLRTVSRVVTPPPQAPAVASTVPSFVPGAVARTTNSQAVALTFDDGPGEQTLAILGLLRQYGVKATFCLIGVRVREHPELVRAIVRDGHTLCNHTWRHDLRLGTRSADAIQSDLRRTNAEIRKAAPGVPIRYFRHPGGRWTPAALSVAQQMGMTAVGWTVDPSDWDIKAYPPGPVLTSHVIRNVKQNVRPGSIVLSHDAGGERRSTVAAYKVLLPYLINERHLTLVRLPVPHDGDERRHVHLDR
jgi:peptidoglycan-N-acetylglucosamine deacetylase